MQTNVLLDSSVVAKAVHQELAQQQNLLGLHVLQQVSFNFINAIFMQSSLTSQPAADICAPSGAACPASNICPAIPAGAACTPRNPLNPATPFSSASGPTGTERYAGDILARKCIGQVTVVH